MCSILYNYSPLLQSNIEKYKNNKLNIFREVFLCIQNKQISTFLQRGFKFLWKFRKSYTVISEIEISLDVLLKVSWILVEINQVWKFQIWSEPWSFRGYNLMRYTLKGILEADPSSRYFRAVNSITRDGIIAEMYIVCYKQTSWK